MQVAVEKLSPVLLELAVQVDAQRVKSELAKAYREVAKTARIKGFRPGKAPRQVLAHVYGRRIAADVAQRLVEETYTEAIAAQQVQPVSQPAIESDSVRDNEPFNYKARVEIVPQIDEIKYEGLEVTKPNTEVTEALLDSELETLRRANSTLEPPKEPRGAREGDQVTIDVDVAVDGEQIEDASAKDFEAELGSNTVLPEIEQALLGKQQGEQVETEIELPAGHPHPKLRGRRAQFRLSLKDIKERVLPDLDDEFAKDLGDFETLDALKEEIKQDLAKRLQEQAENAVAEALVQELVKANPIEVPQSLVAQQNRVTEQELVAQARSRGQQGTLTPQVREQIAADSEVKVRAGLLMAEIAKREGIKIGDAEIEAGIAELAEQTGKNVAKLRAEYRDPKRREMLIGMILENKVLDIVESKANIKQSEPAAAEGSQ